MDSIGESAWLSSNSHHGITEQRHGITLWLAKLVPITLITMVCGRYNELVHGFINQQTSLGGTIMYIIITKKKLSQLFFSASLARFLASKNRSIKLSIQLWNFSPP